MEYLKNNFPNCLLGCEAPQKSLEDVLILPLRGERECSIDELTRVGDLKDCNNIYLESVLTGFEALDLCLLRAMNYGLAQQRKPHTDLGAQSETDDQIEEDTTFQILDDIPEYLTTVQQLRSEIHHLLACPELLGSREIQSAFFKQATQSIRLSRFSFQVYLEVKHMYKPLAARISPSEQHPSRHMNGMDFPPWQTFCRQLPPISKSPTFQAMKKKHENMTLIAAQMLALPGLLIAEHWRHKVYNTITSIVESSLDPFQAEEQLPFEESMVAGQRKRGDHTSIARAAAPNFPRSAMNPNTFAFGKQSPIAEQARFVAHVEKDVSTLGAQAGVFQTTFHTKKGTQLSLDATAFHW